MTTEEFSNEFDVLLSTYSDIDGFGKIANISFNEYEKSVFLTRAQEELVTTFYSGRTSSNDSFEKTEELRRYLGNLVKTYTTSEKETGHTGISTNSVFFKLPPDLWFITYEAVDLKDDKLLCNIESNVTVLPVTQDDYHRIKKNPFRGSNNRRVLRLDIKDNVVEIISPYNIERYIVRYLTRPNPIILEELPYNLTINGSKYRTECELNSVLHRTILERAVAIAFRSKAAFNSSTNTDS